MSQGGNAGNKNVNKKQKKTQESVNREGDETKGGKRILDSVRTHITHNKGGKWELIKAPTIDSDKKKVNCYLDEGCSLHLQIYSSDGQFAPPYSQDSAVGLIMAVGNVGNKLDRSVNEKMNTYLSRDGGLSWAEVRKGAYIYELGDHGGLIVMAKHQVPTKEVLYSYNEGKSWHELEISDSPIDITNIIIEPFSISQQFVVYGQIVEDKKGDDDSTAAPAATRGIVFTLDFKNLHEPQCKGVDRPGEEASDYELWTPYDGRHGDNKCFMGQQVSYVRRKQDAECFNGEELEREIVRSYCPCTELDYECDLGYSKGELGTCTKVADYETKLEQVVKEDQAA
jgi:Sortilin, neurotensin receptor 3,/Sortilin, neurotensin receptor 3, C-terminal